MESMDRKILRCIIEKGMSMEEISSWKQRYEVKSLIDKLLKEWVSLVEKFNVNRDDNKQLRETAHQVLHYIGMDKSAKLIQPYHMCPNCLPKKKKTK